MRTDRSSAAETRREVEKRLDRFLERAAPAEPRIVIRPCTAPRDLRNCADLVFHDVGRSMHVVAHHLAEDRAIFTVTVFDPGMIGQDIELFSASQTAISERRCASKAKFSLSCGPMRPLPPAERSSEPAGYATNSQRRRIAQQILFRLRDPELHARASASVFRRAARAALIARHFSAIVVTAYQSLAPAAYRADLFRYLFAYLNACIYFDVKMC